MKALVTGGGGFLGSGIVRALRDRDWQVRSFARAEYRWHGELGVESYRGDLTDPESVARAVEGCEIVFHVAGKAGVWGAYEDYFAANVTGTDNVIAACRRQAVRRLVYTSSPSVVFDGRDQEGIDESAPYPERFLAAYPETKALAEQRVVAANNAELATVALRPHLIWGPGDNHLVPRILQRAREGKLRRIGRRSPLVDTTYIDNAVHAHLLAAERLQPGSPIAGKAYFISNDDPRPMADIVDGILAAGGLPPVRRSVPVAVAKAAAAAMETVYRARRSATEPSLTRFVVSQMSTAHWFDLSAARRDLDYQPLVPIDEGLERLRRWLTSDRPQ